MNFGILLEKTRADFGLTNRYNNCYNFSGFIFYFPNFYRKKTYSNEGKEGMLYLNEGKEGMIISNESKEGIEHFK